MQLRTKVIAHRGSKGTRPENTIASFQAAIDDGAEGIETDVHFSSDEALVIMHDETVDRTTNGTGLLNKMSLNEIKQLDAGSKFSFEFTNEKVPTLQEVVQLLIDNHFTGIFNLEFKTDKIHYKGIEKVVDNYFKSIDYPFDLIYSSFNRDTVRILRELNPEIEVAKLFKTDGKDAKKLYKENVINAYHPKIKWIKQHPFFAFSKRIRPWVVNTTEDLDFCYRHNMAAVITDYPGKAIKHRKAKEETN